jgi:predicted AlkP superfamily pyrophosphatase or phosphodiesterase
MIGSICRIGPTVARFLGIKMLPERALPVEVDKDYESTVLFLIDSMDSRIFKFLLKNSDFLRRKVIKSGFLTSTFPSVTPTSITSILSGLHPGEHGILGFRFFIEECGKVINFFKLSPVENEDEEGELLEEFDINFKIKDIFSECTAKGISNKLVVPESIAKSKTTPYLTRAEKIESFKNLRELFRKPFEREFVHIYLSSLDETIHKSGTWNEEVRETTRRIAKGIDTWFRKRSFLLFLASDHGQIQVDQSNVIHLRDREILLRQRFFPAVSGGRVIYFYTNDPEGSRDWLKRKCGRSAEVKLSKEVVDSGLFGRFSKEMYPRIGDITLIARGENCFHLPFKDEKFRDKASHGGLSQKELRAPFLIA